MNSIVRKVCRATSVLILSREVGDERKIISVQSFDNYIEAWDQAYAWRSCGWQHTAEIHCIDPAALDGGVN